MKLNVPYYSQYADVNDEYWAPRACGFCCFKMVTEFFGVNTPAIVELANKAKKEGGYGESGIIHDYVVKLAENYGLTAHREEKMDEGKGVQKIADFIKKENPVTVSVTKDRNGKKLFHQVVISGLEEEEDFNLLGFYIHDSATSHKGEGSHLFVPIEDFLKEWRRMAIFIEK
ncbi:MAG: C39 family peptidase [bacterium]|nr:C39 family peptidase [bacterium]